ncbi:hypothetical protein HYDPIDRAFT_165274 [Hydnomerulius pinastri MD-312]|nr:hypothetical protein HYDPIDRAFT_165274 [Hydnomerulius pinastri MD-312]
MPTRRTISCAFLVALAAVSFLSADATVILSSAGNCSSNEFWYEPVRKCAPYGTPVNQAAPPSGKACPSSGNWYWSKGFLKRQLVCPAAAQRLLLLRSLVRNARQDGTGAVNWLPVLPPILSHCSLLRLAQVVLRGRHLPLLADHLLQIHLPDLHHPALHLIDLHHPHQQVITRAGTVTSPVPSVCVQLDLTHVPS